VYRLLKNPTAPSPGNLQGITLTLLMLWCSLFGGTKSIQIAKASAAATIKERMRFGDAEERASKPFEKENRDAASFACAKVGLLSVLK
jgi:hypothetical protein